MHSKCPLPWDLEHTMTAFQVKPDWYEEYWLKPPTSAHVAGPYVRRLHNVSIDIDFYRSRAKRERDMAIKKCGLTLLATIAQLFRRAGSRLRAKQGTPSAMIAPRLRESAKG